MRNNTDIEVFDEHHEAFLFWEDALTKKKNRKKFVLVTCGWALRPGPSFAYRICLYR